MEKAYDRMDWSFLIKVLQKLGFCPKFIEWVKECMQTVSFSVLVNNGPTEPFKPERGLRQGDPLSPYLFVIGAELLARKLQQMCNMNNKTVGIPLARSGTKIPFLAFADDIIIFTKATQGACTLVRRTIDEYCSISGQKVNYHKSSFQTSKLVNNHRKQIVQQALNITTMTDLEKYLGCPIINGKVNKDTFRDTVGNVKDQLTKWKANSLSQAGRTTLIQANLTAKPNYLMQSFLLPSNIHKELDQVNRSFLWNKGPEHKPLIGWDKICKPKSLGGLGIRKSEHMNKALQMKLLWKIIAEPNNIWVRIVNEKYLRNMELFSYKKQTNTSWQWSKLMSLRSEFREGLHWQIGDGRTIRFWTDSWTTKGPLLTYAKGQSMINKEATVNEFFNSEKKWDKTKLEQVLPLEIASEVLEEQIPENDLQDQLYWAPCKNDGLSTSSAIKLIAKEERQVQNPNKWIWKLDTYPKVKNFLWKVDMNGLPTKARLLQKHIHVTPDCLMCNCRLENTEHLLISCPHTQNIVRSINKQTNQVLRTIDTREKTPRQILAELKERLGLQEFTELATIWWCIWTQRNKLAFQQTPNDFIANLEIYIKQQLLHWKKTKNWSEEEDGLDKQIQPRRKSARKIAKWAKPPRNVYKMNFDGSKILSGETTSGFVIRDNDGQVIEMAVGKYGKISVLKAETLALWYGIRTAKNMGIKNIEIEGDNLTVINASKGALNYPWEIDILITDIRRSLQLFESVLITHVGREANVVADIISKMGHDYPTEHIRNCQEFITLIRKDALGWPP